MPDKNTIRLKNYLNNFFEGTLTAVAVTPGMLVEQTSAGVYQKHSTSGGNALPPMFPIENVNFGGGVNDNYAASAKAQIWIPQRGDEVYAILADGQNVAINDPLESNGAGLLQKHIADVESFESNEAGAITVLPNNIVAVALEAIDISDSSGLESSGPLGYDKRIKIRII